MRRVELTEGQTPFAAILGCSDSRVPGETVFDQVPGHIFSVRIAGKYLTNGGLGSLEYGIAVLKAPLILVLGHSRMRRGRRHDQIRAGRSKTGPDQIMGLVVAIEPAVRETKGSAGAWLDNAIGAKRAR